MFDQAEAMGAPDTAAVLEKRSKRHRSLTLCCVYILPLHGHHRRQHQPHLSQQGWLRRPQPLLPPQLALPFQASHFHALLQSGCILNFLGSNTGLSALQDGSSLLIAIGIREEDDHAAGE